VLFVAFVVNSFPFDATSPWMDLRG